MRRTFSGFVFFIWVGVLVPGSWATDGSSDFQLVFDPEIRPLIRSAIAESKKGIAVEVFKLTDRGVIADLAKAAERGVQVRIILCPSQRSNQKAAARLLRAGAQIRWYPLTHKNQIMHLKLGSFDQKLLIFGSPNWTYWGLTLHHEGVLVITRAEIISEMQIQFESDWSKSTDACLSFPAGSAKP